MFHVSGRCDARTVPTCPEGHHCSSLSRCTNLDSVTGSYFYKDIRNFRNQPLFKRSDGMFFNFWRKWNMLPTSDLHQIYHHRLKVVLGKENPPS